jgi:hypothetical protein
MTKLPYDFRSTQLDPSVTLVCKGPPLLSETIAGLGSAVRDRPSPTSSTSPATWKPAAAPPSPDACAPSPACTGTRWKLSCWITGLPRPCAGAGWTTTPVRAGWTATSSAPCRSSPGSARPPTDPACALRRLSTSPTGSPTSGNYKHGEAVARTIAVSGFQSQSLTYALAAVISTPLAALGDRSDPAARRDGELRAPRRVAGRRGDQRGPPGRGAPAS